MQKIGLNICRENNLKYFNSFTKNEIIKISKKSISKISSFSVDLKVIDFDYIKESSVVKIFLSTNLKVLYLIENDSSIYLYEKDFLSVQYINIDNFVDGNIITTSFLKTKAVYQIFVDEIFCQIISKDEIFYSYHIVINLKLNPSFYLGFEIENAVSSNIYVSYSDGTNLTQKTFDNNLTYKNINFYSNLSFVGTFNNMSLIYEVGDLNKINCFSNLRNVDSYCFKNASTIIASLNLNNTFSIFIFDINLKSLKKIPTPPISNSFKNPFFEKQSGNIYLISKINEIDSICYFDKSYKFNVLYSEKNVKSYKVSNDKILFETDTFNVFYIDFNFSNEISFIFEYEKILKIDFYFENIFCILYTKDNLNKLILYNLDTFEITELCPFFSITDFDIDKNTLDIFLCYFENNFSQIVKIDKTLTEFYLENLSGKVVKIFVKKTF